MPPGLERLSKEVAMEGTVPWLKLNTGASIPAVGLGFAGVGEGLSEIKTHIQKAIEVGYRHFDTAEVYNTEVSVGDGLNAAFSAGIVKREDVFVTTKLGMTDMQPPDIIPALRTSLSKLQLDYVDLYLVHWPLRFREGANIFHLNGNDFLPLDLKGCWKAMEEAVELGLAKSIGVSNFGPKHFKQFLPEAKIVPAVNQIEIHPGCEQIKLREYCKQKGILVVAWSPLGAPYGEHVGWGSAAVINNPILKKIAVKHGKSPGQVALRWSLDNDVGLVAKTSNPVRLAENLDLFSWTLDADDHTKIKTIPQHRVFPAQLVCSVANTPFKTEEELWGEE